MFGTVLVVQELVERELRSALPDAPVVSHLDRSASRLRLVRTRSATASALRRTAARIAPAC